MVSCFLMILFLPFPVTQTKKAKLSGSLFSQLPHLISCSVFSCFHGYFTFFQSIHCFWACSLVLTGLASLAFLKSPPPPQMCVCARGRVCVHACTRQHKQNGVWVLNQVQLPLEKLANASRHQWRYIIKVQSPFKTDTLKKRKKKCKTLFYNFHCKALPHEDSRDLLNTSQPI